MTAIAPQVVDATALDALDFDEPVLCDINECHHDKINARSAVSCGVVQHLHEGRGGHVDRGSSGPTTAAARRRRPAAICPKHLTARCAHLALTIEPLL